MYCIKNSYGNIDRTFQLGPALWQHFDLIYVHTGQIKIQIKNSQNPISAGQAILIYPQTEFVGDCISQAAKISVHHFSLDNADNNDSVFEKIINKCNDFKIYHSSKKEFIDCDIERIVGLANKPDSLLNTQTRSWLMLLILTQLDITDSKNSKNDEIAPEFKKLNDWLKENFNKNISLENMAKIVGLSTSHFRALFKKQFGISPGNYLLNIRMSEAARMLRETVIPIKQIAKLTGYSDIIHFYHLFKSTYGTTPKEYRNRHLLLG